jgi:hypothetical protein
MDSMHILDFAKLQTLSTEAMIALASEHIKVHVILYVFLLHCIVAKPRSKYRLAFFATLVFFS